ncbi:MAG TPA: asparagine synthase (glutamine-hydrolyzing), partial [Rhodospirillales bacterium]|nr:asparagine synthase (glutamine-hydrolyzing) [Rhodospirillales bacterium]
MCGLAAIFAYGDKAPGISGDMLSAINDAMARRGPDGQGQWLADDRQIGLAHRRLAIIDLSDKAAQPMLQDHPGGRLAITFNGEIYNFLDLKERLQSENYAFVTNSDTEVLLHLYRRYGPDMVHHLRGMYAFAIWDENRQGLFLARDPFGIKPLYYRDDGKSIAVASQVKALLAGLRAGQMPRPQFNAAGHVGFFLFGHVPDPHTLYKGISALPAGTTLWIDKKGPHPEQQFFSVSEQLQDGASAPSPEDLSDLLRDSLRHHFVADVAVGVFLSSGLDSASLTALASEIKGANLDTLTLGFDEFAGGRHDEVP